MDQIILYYYSTSHVALQRRNLYSELTEFSFVKTKNTENSQDFTINHFQELGSYSKNPKHSLRFFKLRLAIPDINFVRLL